MLTSPNALMFVALVLTLNLALAILFVIAYSRSDRNQEGYIARQDRRVSESLKSQILLLDAETAPTKVLPR